MPSLSRLGPIWKNSNPYHMNALSYSSQTIFFFLFFTTPPEYSYADWGKFFDVLEKYLTLNWFKVFNLLRKKEWPNKRNVFYSSFFNASGAFSISSSRFFSNPWQEKNKKKKKRRWGGLKSMEYGFVTGCLSVVLAFLIGKINRLIQLSEALFRVLFQASSIAHTSKGWEKKLLFVQLKSLRSA